MRCSISGFFFFFLPASAIENLLHVRDPVSRSGRCRWEVKKLPGGSRALLGCDCSRQDEVSTDKVRPLMDGQSRELDVRMDGARVGT